MDEGLKKRLLGAAVLASLTVIFVPMLIEEPSPQAPPMRAVPTPPQPSFDPIPLGQTVVQPKPPPLRVPPEVAAVAPATAPVTQSPAPPPAEKPQTPVSVAPKTTPATNPSTPPANRAALSAWIVQAGSFANRDNALALTRKLRKAGFQSPDPDQVNVKGRPLYRVLVGPFVERAEAAAQLGKVEKATGSRGLVLHYQ